MSPEETRLWKFAIRALVETPAGWGIILCAFLWVVHLVTADLVRYSAHKTNSGLVKGFTDLSKDVARILGKLNGIGDQLTDLLRRVDVLVQQNERE